MAPYVDPDPVPLAPAGRLVEEGLLIARQAIAMDVKNRALIRVIRDGGRFDREQIRRDVETELNLQAEEQDASAARMTAELRDLDNRWSISEHQHDYREADAEALLRRRDVYRGLAAELRRLSSDDAFTSSIVDTVRLDLWSEVSSAIDARLRHTSRLADDEEYTRMRAERMRTVREVDLELLERRRGLRAAVDELDDW
ncbi:hypothetical protein GCM10027416_32540 [Okibacterium endophyticum]